MNSGLKRTWLVFIAGLGFMLSPLSWWNDPYVNIPISYAAANLAHRIHPSLFMPGFAGAYWLTNALGLLLLHVGIEGAANGRMSRANTRKWLLWSAIYTVAIVALCCLGILRPVKEYFPAE